MNIKKIIGIVAVITFSFSGCEKSEEKKVSPPKVSVVKKLKVEDIQNFNTTSYKISSYADYAKVEKDFQAIFEEYKKELDSQREKKEMQLTPNFDLAEKVMAEKLKKQDMETYYSYLEHRFESEFVLPKKIKDNVFFKEYNTFWGKTYNAFEVQRGKVKAEFVSKEQKVKALIDKKLHELWSKYEKIIKKEDPPKKYEVNKYALEYEKESQKLFSKHENTEMKYFAQYQEKENHFSNVHTSTEKALRTQFKKDHLSLYRACLELMIQKGEFSDEVRQFKEKGDYLPYKVSLEKAYSTYVAAKTAAYGVYKEKKDKEYNAYEKAKEALRNKYHI